MEASVYREVCVKDMGKVNTVGFGREAQEIGASVRTAVPCHITAIMFTGKLPKNPIILVQTVISSSRATSTPPSGHPGVTP
jgi:hypothetical protein